MALRLTSVIGIGHAEDPNPRFRKQMEDVCIMIDKFGNSPTTGFYAVYDGHGGQDAARIAGDNLHRYFLEQIIQQKQEHLLEANDTAPQGLRGEDRVPETPPPPSPLGLLLQQAIERTDEVLRQKNVLYTGCTALIALVTRNTIEFASVGDSRAVISIAGKAFRCTNDHKASDKGEIERIKAAGGVVTFGRVNGFISVSRALGDHCIKNLVICTPFLRSYSRYPSSVDQKGEPDEFVILACDGIWDVVTDQESVDVVRKCLKETGSPQKAAFELKSLALKNGTQDNLTVLVLLLREVSSWP
ncbi:putative Ser/Thr phosphatase 2C [Giardia muris]|uniref:Putative Ser/Thr phosphatase 2C n=1 Tax=Giardia muris TaxID=5742 RepID=A0A4Z1SW82_GIAMU|nr:putative Ser/Thr phosphatase 2C [Giardia muris]|eukprot:TNJ29850.1 putative Ser/Thr phosphatase 2C [Giardia muris]